MRLRWNELITTSKPTALMTNLHGRKRSSIPLSRMIYAFVIRLALWVSLPALEFSLRDLGQRKSFSHICFKILLRFRLFMSHHQFKDILSNTFPELVILPRSDTNKPGIQFSPTVRREATRQRKMSFVTIFPYILESCSLRTKLHDVTLVDKKTLFFKYIHRKPCGQFIVLDDTVSARRVDKLP